MATPSEGVTSAALVVRTRPPVPVDDAPPSVEAYAVLHSTWHVCMLSSFVFFFRSARPLAKPSDVSVSRWLLWPPDASSMALVPEPEPVVFVVEDPAS